MTNNWTNIHPDFAYHGREWETNYQQEWENNGFTYQQTQEWISIGLQPTEANFCGWLVKEGYTALAALNHADITPLRAEYQQSLISKPLFDWYSEKQLTFQEFSLLANHLGLKVKQDYQLDQLKELLTKIPPSQANYRYTKIILTVIILAGISYYLLHE